MKSRMMRKVAVLVTGSALALSFPVAGAVANQGGVPNGGVGSGKTCKQKGKGAKKPAPNSKGQKCGFHKQDANGQLQNGNLGDYMIASIEDMPPDLSLNVLEHPEANEIHGIGETSLPPVMPAIGNAVYRATAVRIQDLPITAEKVLRGLQELRERADGWGPTAGGGATSVGDSSDAPSLEPQEVVA